MDFTNTDIYSTHSDTDIAFYTWFSGQSTQSNDTKPNPKSKPPVPISLDPETAEKYGNKITKLATEKGAIISPLDKNKTSYPIFGHVIFTLRFNKTPKINNLEEVSRTDILKKIDESSGEYHMTSYIPNWTQDKTRRYVLNSSAYEILTLKYIKLVPTTKIDTHIGFCLLNGLGLDVELVQLLRELIVNGNGKSFISDNKIGGHVSMDDPFYPLYLKYKKQYMANKAKNNLL